MSRTVVTREFVTVAASDGTGGTMNWTPSPRLVASIRPRPGSLGHTRVFVAVGVTAMASVIVAIGAAPPAAAVGSVLSRLDYSVARRTDTAGAQALRSYRRVAAEGHTAPGNPRWRQAS